MDVTIDLGVPEQHAVIAVRGDLDVHLASALREALECLLMASGDHPLIDVTGMRVLDEAARATLEGVARHCREFGGELRLPTGRTAT